MNPNDCDTCEHKKHPEDGWCYMFRAEPVQPCYQHTRGTMIGCVFKSRKDAAPEEER